MTIAPVTVWALFVLLSYDGVTLRSLAAFRTVEDCQHAGQIVAAMVKAESRRASFQFRCVETVIPNP